MIYVEVNQFIASKFIIYHHKRLFADSNSLKDSNIFYNCIDLMNRFRLNNQLSLINQQEDQDLNLTARIPKLQTSPDINQKGVQQNTQYSKSTGLDRFISFLEQPPSKSDKKLKPLPQTKNRTNTDNLNPQNHPKPRPRSSIERDSLNKFTDFLQSQDLAIQEKTKTKKQKKNHGLNKFMETLNVAETVKQQKKLGNIVSGILALSQNLPQLSMSKQKYRYLINSQKFAEIRPKSKQKKVRSHSAQLSSRKSKEFKKPINDQQKQKQLGKVVLKKGLIGLDQISEKALERKVKFFENIGGKKSLRAKGSQSNEMKNFAFLN